MVCETLNEDAVKITETKERSYIFYFSWRGPILDAGNFDGVTSGDVCPDLGWVPVDTSSDDVHSGANPKENCD